MLLRLAPKFRNRRREDSLDDFRTKVPLLILPHHVQFSVPPQVCPTQTKTQKGKRKKKNQGTREPDITIRLTSSSRRRRDEVRFSFTSGRFETVRDDDPLLHLLTLPSRTVHRSEAPPGHGLLLPLSSTASIAARVALLHPKFPSVLRSDSRASSEDAGGGGVGWKKAGGAGGGGGGDDDDEDGVDDIGGVGESIYEDTIGGARHDQQPNPFNYSERVSQTIRLSKKNVGVQTVPPPSTTFGRAVGLCCIHRAYKQDYARLMEEEEEEQEREHDRRGGGSAKMRKQGSGGPLGKTGGVGVDVHAPDPLVIVRRPEPRESHQLGQPSLRLPGLLQAARVLERMVAQNTYDHIAQDFKYWEDGSDEFRGPEGSLLPLWKFHHDRSRALLLSDLSWSPVYHDLFAAAYAAGEVGGAEGPGMLCVFTLKNPSTPEKVFHSPASVTCVHLHPQYGNVVGAGWSDGTVVVYDLRSPSTPITSTPPIGKHLLPVTQVRWVRTGVGEEMSLFSVSMEGRVTRWGLGRTSLHPSLILDLSPSTHHTTPPPPPPRPPPTPTPPPPPTTTTNITSSSTSSHSNQHGNRRSVATPASASNNRISLKGVATCIAFKPDDQGVVVVGVDSGAVFHCSTSCPAHSLLLYPAHAAPVRKVAWNPHHHAVFLSCSVDWTIKIWLQYSLSPLLVLDVGGAVAAASWSPHSSSVVVAVSEEGRVSVYDLAMRRCRPLCSQALAQRRKVAATCLDFNPFHPVVLVGGERGHLVALKLSPNLRRPHKEAKGADPQQLRELELAKIDRLIATANKG
ncbi:hypothetical protein Pcinc_016382 [Petrolisthes cinctipes]|uniref:Dynein intermediate chain 1, axonemal n=1 Tax=Petrolisthes cinctipes TaxID=88211 RepID=A0AAE1FSK0_PETCI|nr:hypothetical protein Pcinc_016382 [Petrolisthes cinctipes]